MHRVHGTLATVIRKKGWITMDNKDRKAMLLLADGFEECEGLITVDILRRAGVDVQMVSVMKSKVVESSRSIRVEADIMLGEADYDSADMLILPGGRVGTDNLSASPEVREQCIRFAEDRYLAAICAAPTLLAELGLLNGKRATCHPDMEGRMGEAVLTRESVTVDGTIITGQGLGATFDFAYKLASILTSEEKVLQVKQSICWKY